MTNPIQRCESVPKSSLPFWFRLGAIAIALNVVCFFRGCAKPEGAINQQAVVVGTLGVAVPYVSVELGIPLGCGALPSHLFEFSPALMTVNVLVALLFGAVIMKLRMLSRAWVSLVVSVALTNSFLLWGRLYVYAVIWPVSWIANVPEQALGLRPSAGGVINTDVASRIWFAVMFGLGYGLVVIVARLSSWRQSRTAAGA